MGALERNFGAASGRDITAAARELPLPGGGQTARRHMMLCEWGRADLAAARLAEAHTDAVAILAEAGVKSDRNALYGVWAAESPDGRLHASLRAGSWYLDGVKAYCGGAPLVTEALVTALHGEERLLFLVPLDRPGIAVQDSTWASHALATTETRNVKFEGVALSEKQLIRTPGWYLDRPGFWHGALGPAACWAGGAISLIDAARVSHGPDEHAKAHVGALAAIEWAMRQYLDAAGREIDADPEVSPRIIKPQRQLRKHH